MIRRLLSAGLFTVLIAATACGGGSTTTAPSTSVGVYTQTDLVLGTGATAVAGNSITVAYTGWLYDTSKADGKGNQFDSQSSIQFQIGVGKLIKGWDQGIPGMKVGGQRRLIIPPDLAYGSTSPSSSIPPNATLVFDIKLLSVP